MLLVDSEIASLVDSSQLIDPFYPENITNIGYDLTAENFYLATSKEKKTTFSLMPNESVFVGTKENIKLPNNIATRIVLKNSRIRQGLLLTSPLYQPGHHTKVFFRLTNVSGDEIFLSSGEKYATAVFEQLSQNPDRPYSGTFSNEFDFRGLGNYQAPYDAQITKLEKKAEELKSIERNIYGNVLVILTVFVALFTFITTNLSLMSQSASMSQFLIYNFVTLGCIAFLVAIMSSFIGTTQKRSVWWPCIIPFFTAFIIVLIKKFASF